MDLVKFLPSRLSYQLVLSVYISCLGNHVIKMCWVWHSCPVYKTIPGFVSLLEPLPPFYKQLEGRFSCLTLVFLFNCDLCFMGVGDCHPVWWHNFILITYTYECTLIYKGDICVFFSNLM